jgi:hypothetical protein
MTAKMGHRRFDYHVLRAACEILYAYSRHLFLKPKTHPFYVFNLHNIELGKYLTTSVLRDVDTNRNKIRFAIKFHTNLMRSFFVYGAALRARKTTAAISLGDAFYMDGIWIDFFLNMPGVTVYLDFSPYGAICVSENFRNLTALRNKLDSNRRRLPMSSLHEVRRHMKERLEDPKKAIYYYTATKSQFVVSSEHQELPLTAIIYAHSFTDSQMENGFDGFKSVYDWLLFTLETIKEHASRTNLFIKAHPSFFSETNERDAEVLDRELWKLLESEIPSNVHIVNSTVTNWEFLKQFEPESTVLISHHGNAVVEGAYLGFQSISSVASPWGSNYKFSTTWSSKEEYARLLRLWDFADSMKSERHSEVAKFISDVYMSEVSSISSDSYYLNVVARHCDRSVEELRLNPFSEPAIDTRSRSNAIRQLSASVKIAPFRQGLAS